MSDQSQTQPQTAEKDLLATLEELGIDPSAMLSPAEDPNAYDAFVNGMVDPSTQIFTGSILPPPVGGRMAADERRGNKSFASTLTPSLSKKFISDLAKLRAGTLKTKDGKLLRALNYVNDQQRNNPGPLDMKGLVTVLKREGINVKYLEDKGYITKVSQPRRGTKNPDTGKTTRRGPSRDTFSTAGDLLKDFYKFDKNKLLQMQKLLFAGGFFGNATIGDIQWGRHDEDSFRAWATAVTRTARFNQSGSKVTVEQVLSSLAAQGGSFGAGGDQQVRSVSLSDPAELRSTLDSVASKVLGRNANLEEQRMFVALIHRLQSDSQLALQPVLDQGLDASSIGSLDQLDAAVSAQMSGQLGGSVAGGPIDVTATQPSPVAQAQETLRAQNPAEAGAHDIALQFANFLQLLNSPVDI